MYARLTERARDHRTASSRTSSPSRFRQITESRLGRARQEGTQPLGHRRQVRRGQGASARARGHRELLRRRGTRVPASTRKQATARTATSTASARCRATSSRSATRLEHRFGRLGRDYGTDRLRQGPSSRRTRRSNGSRPATRSSRPSATTALDRVHDDLQTGAVFFDLHRKAPALLDVFAASVKDGRGKTLHRRLFVVETAPRARWHCGSRPSSTTLRRPRTARARPTDGLPVAGSPTGRAVPLRAGLQARGLPRTAAPASTRDRARSPATSRSA